MQNYLIPGDLKVTNVTSIYAEDFKIDRNVTIVTFRKKMKIYLRVLKAQLTETIVPGNGINLQTYE
ncbi:MAG TPA: hypothetical protein VK941_04680 [Gillisia sp.]|nr:hypothetical protein [Gillisia sp.]